MPSSKTGELLVYLEKFFALIMFALTLLFWPVGAVLRKHYGLQLSVAQRLRGLRPALAASPLAFSGELLVQMCRLPSGLKLSHFRRRRTLT